LLLIGVQAYRLPAFKRFKSYPKATSMALWAFKLAVCQPFNASNASKASWNAQPRRQKLAQGHFKIPSYGRSSLPFARP
jgi:hypothetical protein